MSDARLQKLLEKRAHLQAQIKDATSRQRQQHRKDDTRRKVIIGALALEHMEKNKTSPFAKTLWPLLDEYVTRPQDRALLNAYFKTVDLQELPPLPETPANDPGKSDPALKTEFPKSTTA